MFESISLAAALIGSVAGGIYDLKTTDMLDIIPYSMIVIALILHGVESYLVSDYWVVLSSVIFGFGLLTFGYVMYFFGQWGAGDAWMLSAVGFLLSGWEQKLLFPFPVTYLFNVFFVGTVYMLAYAVVVSLMNRRIISEFKKEMKASSKLLVIGSSVLFFSIFIFNWFLTDYLRLFFSPNSILTNSVLPVALTIVLFVVWKFARTVENFGFKKKIHVSKLKVGDVLLESRLFKGLAEREVMKIRRSKKYVWVKEGVRFAPTFPLALLFTLYFGDGILFFVKFLI